jgi:hypothetical protein
MISAWWLALLPIAGGIGLLFGGLFAEKGRQDDCADCQYNCKTCQYKKEKSK